MVVFCFVVTSYFFKLLFVSMLRYGGIFVRWAFTPVQVTQEEDSPWAKL